MAKKKGLAAADTNKNVKLLMEFLASYIRYTNFFLGPEKRALTLKVNYESNKIILKYNYKNVFILDKIKNAFVSMTGIHMLLYHLVPQHSERQVLDAVKVFIKRISQNMKRKDT